MQLRRVTRWASLVALGVGLGLTTAAAGTTTPPTVLYTLPVATTAQTITLAPDGNSLWVTGFNSINGLSLVSLTTSPPTVTTTRLLAASGAPGVPTTEPNGLALSLDGATAYVADWNNGTINKIDTASPTGQATQYLYVGRRPAGALLSPDGTTLYVPCLNSQFIAVVDTSTFTLTRTIATPHSPDGVALSPDGKTLAVAMTSISQVAIIDAATGTLTRTLTDASLADPVAPAFSPDGTKLYVANYYGNSVTAFTVATGVGAAIAVGNGPDGVAVTPGGHYLWVANAADGTVSRVDLATSSVLDTTTVGARPYHVAVSSDGATVYVTNRLDNTLSILSAAADPVTTTTTTTTTGPTTTVPSLAFTGAHTNDESVLGTSLIAFGFALYWYGGTPQRRNATPGDDQ